MIGAFCVEEESNDAPNKVDSLFCDTHCLWKGFQVLSSQLTQKKPGYVEFAF